jgi:carboxymethylenebutenolidase
MNKTILRVLFSSILIVGAAVMASAQAALPPAEADALSRLVSSPRHGEWVTVQSGDDSVEAWVVYPERQDRAPVVLVIHEIFGLNDWARAVADQLAADGFIAVAPDFLSGKGPDGKGTSSLTVDAARQINSSLQPAEVVRRLNAVAAYATKLPAATGRFGVVGYCWGGGMSFLYATQQPNLGAVSPATVALARVRAPVLGLYGGDDARVNATIPAAQEELKRLGKRYEVELYDGAGHAFLRQQDGKEGANLRAAQKAWPRTVQFLKQALGDQVSLAEPQLLPASFSGAELDCICEEELAAGGPVAALND